LSTEGFADAWHSLPKTNFVGYAAGIPSQFAFSVALLVLDLKAINEPAVRNHLPRIVKNGDFAIFGSADGERPHVTINDHSLIKALRERRSA
jgi:hypothetical protein